jgi:hypothetical protein
MSIAKTPKQIHQIDHHLIIKSTFLYVCLDFKFISYFKIMKNRRVELVIWCDASHYFSRDPYEHVAFKAESLNDIVVVIIFKVFFIWKRIEKKNLQKIFLILTHQNYKKHQKT